MAQPKDTPQTQGATPQRPSARTTSTQDDVVKRFEEPRRQFLQEMRDCWSFEDFQNRALEAYIDYVRALQEANYDYLKSLEAYVRYWQAIQDAWLPEETRKRSRDAYLNYIRRLQQAWATLDTKALDDDTHAGLCSEMMTSALYLSSVPTYSLR